MVQIISSFCKYFRQSSSTEVPFSSEPCWHPALHPRNCHLLGVAWAMAKWSQFLSVSPKSEWWNCYRDVVCWGQQSSSSLLLLLQFEEKFSAMMPSKRPTMQGEQGVWVQEFQQLSNTLPRLMSSLCDYWADETSSVTFGSTRSWWDLQRLCFQSDFTEHETRKKNSGSILLELILSWLIPNFIQIRQCRWELTICIDTVIWRGRAEELFKIHMEFMSSVSEHG